MRLLVIFALLLVSLGLGPPAGAQAHHEGAAQHQSHATHEEHRRGAEGDRERDEVQRVAHVCPGCAFLVEPPLADGAAMRISVPGLPFDPPSLQSFHANPISPPPRLS
jgi:hypothetical protein